MKIDHELKLPPEEKDEFGYTPSQNKIIEKQMVKDTSKSKGAWKAFVKANQEAEKKAKPRQENVIERINRINYEYGDSKKRPKHLDNKDIYSFEDRPKKVAKKIPVLPPKPDMVNGHSDWNPDDWMHSIDPAWWLPDEPDKSSGILEQDLANEYWQEQFENYQNNGGTLNYQQFMQLQLQQKVSNEINKRVKDKQRTEGIAAILGIPGNKI